MDTAVSRETSAETISARRYRSPALRARVEATERALLEAALAEMRLGNFRPSGKVLAARAGYTQASINARFGSIDLMRRRLARERWETIAALAGLGSLSPSEQKRLVWLIMAGARPDLPLSRSSADDDPGLAGRQRAGRRESGDVTGAAP